MTFCLVMFEEKVTFVAGQTLQSQNADVDDDEDWVSGNEMKTQTFLLMLKVKSERLLIERLK
jgi:hypothetical protein